MPVTKVGSEIPTSEMNCSACVLIARGLQRGQDAQRHAQRQ
jgi:hypothetical protein